MRVFLRMFPRGAEEDRLTISSEPKIDLVFRAMPSQYGGGGITDVVSARLEPLVQKWFEGKAELAKLRSMANSYELVADDYVRTEIAAGPVDHLTGDDLIDTAVLCFEKMSVMERERFQLRLNELSGAKGPSAEANEGLEAYGTAEQLAKAIDIVKNGTASRPEMINKHLTTAGLPKASPEQIAAMRA